MMHEKENGMNKILTFLLILAVLLTSCALPTSPTLPASPPPPRIEGALALARSKIKHIVVIMQENRSFDHYFGTYPGADGFPRQKAQFSVCVNDPMTGQCVYPFHDPADKNYGGPHGEMAATAAIDGGKMDGFIAVAESGKAGCENTNSPACGGTSVTDVMGYHDAREIPNYWAYAENFVLQDKLFEPNASWSLPQHLFMVSEWSAKCSKAEDPMSCVSALQSPQNPPDFQTGGKSANSNSVLPDYAWTDLTYLLFKNQVSWK